MPVVQKKKKIPAYLVSAGMMLELSQVATGDRGGVYIDRPYKVRVLSVGKVRMVAKNCTAKCEMVIKVRHAVEGVSVMVVHHTKKFWAWPC